MTDGIEPKDPTIGIEQGVSSPEITLALPRSTDLSSHESELEPSPDYVTIKNEQDSKREWEFVLNQQRYFSEYVRFADTKASFLFAFSVGSLGFLYQDGVYKELSGSLMQWFQNKPLFGIATALFLLSFIQSMAAILPRLWKENRSTKGLVFWDDVLSLGPSDYYKIVRKSSSEDLTREVSLHCYDLALVCHGKYECIKYALWAAAWGSIFTAFALFWR